MQQQILQISKDTANRERHLREEATAKDEQWHQMWTKLNDQLGGDAIKHSEDVEALEVELNQQKVQSEKEREEERKFSEDRIDSLKYELNTQFETSQHEWELEREDILARKEKAERQSEGLQRSKSQERELHQQCQDRLVRKAKGDAYSGKLEAEDRELSQKDSEEMNKRPFSSRSEGEETSVGFSEWKSQRETQTAEKQTFAASEGDPSKSERWTAPSSGFEWWMRQRETQIVEEKEPYGVQREHKQELDQNVPGLELVMEVIHQHERDSLPSTKVNGVTFPVSKREDQVEGTLPSMKMEHGAPIYTIAGERGRHELSTLGRPADGLTQTRSFPTGRQVGSELDGWKPLGTSTSTSTRYVPHSAAESTLRESFARSKIKQPSSTRTEPYFQTKGFDAFPTTKVEASTHGDKYHEGGGRPSDDTGGYYESLRRDIAWHDEARRYQEGRNQPGDIKYQAGGRREDTERSRYPMDKS
jgi:hypothetical protein